MSMHPKSFGEVPAETARVARAAFPKGSLAIRIRDELGVLFTDEQFAPLFAVRGRPAWSPGLLALVSVLQFVENLSDRQAAEALRARIDWKYATGLELSDQGFDFSVLCEFRARLVESDAGRQDFEQVLQSAGEAGLLRRGRARTDSTKVFGAGWPWPSVRYEPRNADRSKSSTALMTCQHRLTWRQPVPHVLGQQESLVTVIEDEVEPHLVNVLRSREPENRTATRPLTPGRSGVLRQPRPGHPRRNPGRAAGLGRSRNMII